MHQYRIGLGDFTPESNEYTQHPAKKLMWFYFIFATFFTMIIFLNMIIAIMGQTFERVSTSARLTKLKERTSMYADF